MSAASNVPIKANNTWTKQKPNAHTHTLTVHYSIKRIELCSRMKQDETADSKIERWSWQCIQNAQLTKICEQELLYYSWSAVVPRYIRHLEKEFFQKSSSHCFLKVVAIEGPEHSET